MCEEGVALADAGRARVGAAGVPALAVVDEHGAGLGRGRVDELGRVSGRDRGEHRAVRARDLRRQSVSTGGGRSDGMGMGGCFDVSGRTSPRKIKAPRSCSLTFWECLAWTVSTWDTLGLASSS